jgi:large subunit ribosomal protein L6
MEIPNGLTVRVDGRDVIVKGPQGEVRKTMAKTAKVSVQGSSLSVDSSELALKNTTEAVIRGMMEGASKGFIKNMKLLHAHFPISVEVKGSEVTIKNFLGEKQPRKTVLIGATKVVAKGASITISGPDKEAVGQTLANIRTAMKIKDKDGRVFQDGIYEAE